VPDRARLLRATAANHRAWFRRQAGVRGGRVERVGGLDVVVAGRFGTIAFLSGQAPACASTSTTRWRSACAR
jgi:hypothetical protein